MFGFWTMMKSWAAPPRQALLDHNAMPYLPDCGLEGFRAQLAETRSPSKVLGKTLDAMRAEHGDELRLDSHPFGPEWSWLCAYTTRIVRAAADQGLHFDPIKGTRAFAQWFLFHAHTDRDGNITVYEATGQHVLLDTAIAQATPPADLKVVWAWSWHDTLTAMVPPPSALQQMLALVNGARPDPKVAAHAASHIGVDKTGAMVNSRVVRDVGRCLDAACVGSIVRAAGGST